MFLLIMSNAQFVVTYPVTTRRAATPCRSHIHCLVLEAPLEEDRLANFVVGKVGCFEMYLDG